jgi:hypothetical protein
MPLQATSGAASYDGFGGGVAVVPQYIEDVFSTWLYTGTGATQTITNNIDLSGKGGLVWIKKRSGANEHGLWDTSRPPFGGGYSLRLASNTTNAQAYEFNQLTSFNSNGFSLGGDGATNAPNVTDETYASWTFRKQPKFFDVVTYTGTGSAQNIAHSLGSVPGCIIVKGLTSTPTNPNWAVYHRSLGNDKQIQLNSTAAAGGSSITSWNNTDPTSTVFTVGTTNTTNASGQTYVAYIFAHDAGGFGLTGTDNVISCGSFTTNGSGAATVDLGYEPQWFLFKRSDDTSNWRILDVMRGGSLTQSSPLIPNLSSAESSFGSFWSPTATGFNIINQTASSTWIYIAIRRGPMKVPTTGTSVFGLSARTGTGADATVTGSAGVSDAVLVKNRGSAVASLFSSRLTGTGYLVTSTQAAEVAAGTTILQANPWDVMDGVKVGTTSTITNASSNTFINYLFDRAPGFFDEVCYTGTGVARTVAHNLAAVPELIIVKNRVASNGWITYCAYLPAPLDDYLFVNSDSAKGTSSGTWKTPTTTTWGMDISFSELNTNGSNYVSYLFATCAGVSKVGSYTGTGTTQTINCGFTAGSRFVMIKRIDSTGDWYVWDSARGIVSGNDSYLLLNSTAAEVTNTDYIDTYSAGFEISSTAPAAINASGGSFIFFAVA